MFGSKLYKHTCLLLAFKPFRAHHSVAKVCSAATAEGHSADHTIAFEWILFGIHGSMQQSVTAFHCKHARGVSAERESL
jgi:hypothetical protein